MTPFPRDRPDYTFQDPTPAQVENTRAIMKARPYTPTSNDLVVDYEHGVEHDPAGTFTCPICGLDEPHHHTAKEIEAYKAAQPTLGDNLPTSVTLVDELVADPTVLPGWGDDPVEVLPAPKLGEVEIFMPEDVVHALHIFDVGSADETPESRTKAMRHVLMFALQVATVNLGVKPEGMITERPIDLTPQGFVNAATDKRAKVKAARKQNKIRRKSGWPKS